MSEQQFDYPQRWAAAIIRHVKETGHSDLHWADSSEEQLLRIVCPGCDMAWAMKVYATKQEDAFRDPFKTHAGKEALLRTMIAQGQGKFPEVLRPSVWERLAEEDGL